MNCGCLPGFPGENRKQLLNAIVCQEGLVGGDFEAFQEGAWEIARSGNEAFTRGTGGGVCVLQLYLGRNIYCTLIFGLFLSVPVNGAIVEGWLLEVGVVDGTFLLCLGEFLP